MEPGHGPHALQVVTKAEVVSSVPDGVGKTIADEAFVDAIDALLAIGADRDLRRDGFLTRTRVDGPFGDREFFGVLRQLRLSALFLRAGFEACEFPRTRHKV